MLCTWKHQERTHSGAVLCYSDPAYPEEEQENPFLRYRRNLFRTSNEYKLAHCSLLDMSTIIPDVMEGAICSSFSEIGVPNISFEVGQKSLFILDFMSGHLESLNRELWCFCNKNSFWENGPMWKQETDQIVFEKLKLCGHASTVSGALFTREWLAMLIVSLCDLTSSFVEKMMKDEGRFQIRSDNREHCTLKDAVDDKIVWLLFPLSKPRCLKSWITDTSSASSIHTQDILKLSPVNFGIYLAALRMEDDSSTMVLRCHDQAESALICYHGTDVSEATGSKASSKSFLAKPKGTGIVYNFNLTYKGLKEPNDYGYIRCGMWGNIGYVNAVVYPVNRSALKSYPQDPCRSLEDSRNDFVKEMEKEHSVEVPHLKELKIRWVENAIDLIDICHYLSKKDYNFLSSH